MDFQRRLVFVGLFVVLALAAWSYWPQPARAMTEHGEGPALQSSGPLAFGTEGTLFMADIRDASIVAVNVDSLDTGAPGVEPIDGLETKIAALLGADVASLAFSDLAVNPKTGHVFLSVQRNGTPALVRISRADVSLVVLTNVPFSKALLSDMPRGVLSRGARTEVITDMALVGDHLWVAGLSNEEFSSKLRSIRFPFERVERGASVEIFHGSHGGWETASPVYTFVPFSVDGEDRLITGYLCTPLVMFTMADLRAGERVQGRTIAELGNMNRPLDMIVYRKNGEDYLLMSNTDRGIMKIPTSRFSGASAITARVTTDRAGVRYEQIGGWGKVEQLDRLSDNQAVTLTRNTNGALDLRVVSLP